ncbi:hypothetical protein D3C83_96840 [compost metagenome]
MNEISDNKLKYLKVNAASREALRREWNRPVLWPLLILFFVFLVSVLPAIRTYRRRERMAARPAA